MWRKDTLFKIPFFILISSCCLAQQPPPQPYEVTPAGTSVRGDLWLSDGGTYLHDSDGDTTGGNRLRIGGELNVGEDYRFILGWTFLDIFSTGESTSDVGDISRYGMDFDFGYFIITDTLWAKYSLHLEDVHGSQAIGYHDTLGHGASVGWRFYQQNKFNLNLELSYLYVQEKNVSTFNFFRSTPISSATYPAANAVSIGIRAGFDIGGR